MKKLFLLLFVFGAFTAFAQDAILPEDDGETQEVSSEQPAAPKKGIAAFDMSAADLKTGFRRADRRFEVYLIGMDAGISNSWFNQSEIVDVAEGFLGTGKDFNVTDYIDKGALSFEQTAFLKPVGFRLKLPAFLLDIGTSFENSIRFNMAEDTLSSLKKMSDAKDNSSSWSTLAAAAADLKGEFNMGGSAFLSIDAAGEMTLLKNKLWVRGGPSFYIPMLFIPKGGIGFQGKKDGDWLTLDGTGKIDAWTSDDNLALGMDLQAEARYAVFPILDAGVSISNIPMIPATMKNKQSLTLDMAFSVPDPNNTNGSLNLSDIDKIKMENPSFNFSDAVKEDRIVLRPTRFDFYGIVKPFSSKLLLVKPSVGFSLNTAMASSTFNFGLACQLNIPVLSVEIGTKLFEEAWSQYASIIIDLHVLELELGAALRGVDFANSWSGKGMDVVLGLKAGF